MGLAVGGAGVLESWQTIVADNLSHTEEAVRVRACQRSRVAVYTVPCM